LSVIGEQFKDAPEVFTWARDFFEDHIDRWGYQEGRSEYESALGEADIIVTTAIHEFFGISVVEAIAAGAYPVLPKRLSYPEIISGIETETDNEIFYDGSVRGLAKKIIFLAEVTRQGRLWGADSMRGVRGVERFTWARLLPVLDSALEFVTKKP